jgi:hypothetical protein
MRDRDVHPSQIEQIGDVLGALQATIGRMRRLSPSSSAFELGGKGMKLPSEPAAIAMVQLLIRATLVPSPLAMVLGAPRRNSLSSGRPGDQAATMGQGKLWSARHHTTP